MKNIYTTPVTSRSTDQAGLCLRLAARQIRVKQTVYVLGAILTYLLISTTADAQTLVTSQTINWQVGPVENITTDQTEPAGDIITTDGMNQIEWKDGGGTIKYRFAIQSATTTWTDLNAPGSVTYDFTHESQPAQLTITRAGSVTTIHVKLYMQETPVQEYEMTVTNFTLL